MGEDMLVKTGDAQILDVVDPKETTDDDKRKDALASALEKAKKRIGNTSSNEEKTEEKTES